MDIRLAGAEFTDIRKYAAENGWRVSDSQLWRYIRKTDEILAQSLERDREKLLNRHLAQRFALYARAMSVSDYRTALAVLKDQAELQGLYSAEEAPDPAPQQQPVVQITQIVQTIVQAVHDIPEARERVASALLRSAMQIQEQAGERP